ncbi:MAG: hypothetical protein KGQ59_08225 [Bdellovibrionales bacterium]|nr:hypothetical protein [Bdellovibrionales bacterium]
MKRVSRGVAFLGLTLTFSLVLLVSLNPHGNPPESVFRSKNKQTAPGPTRIPRIHLDDPSWSAPPPSKKDYIEDLEHDPHMVPRSLMRYATKIAKLQDQARRDPVSAEKLMQELESCVLSTQVIDTARIFCARQSRKLARESPEQAHLSERASALWEVLHHLSQQGIGELSSR